jgi:hypothetical protein
LNLFGDFADVLCPYLDPNVLDLLLSLPAAMLEDKTLHSETIAAAYPQHAGVTYEEKRPRAIPGSYVRRLCLETMAYATLGARSRIVDLQWVAPRLMLGGLSGSPARLRWPRPQTIAYLLQLERCLRRQRAQAL